MRARGPRPYESGFHLQKGIISDEDNGNITYAFGSIVTHRLRPRGHADESARRCGCAASVKVIYERYNILRTGLGFAVVSSIGVWLYDTTTYRKVALLAGRTAIIYSVAFSPDGKTLASRGESGDKTVWLWDTATWELKHTLTGHTRSVNSLLFSPDGKTLASGGYDNTVRLWDTATWETEAHAHWAYAFDL